MEFTHNKDLFQAVFDSASNAIAVMEPILDENGKCVDFSILLLNTFALSRLGEIDYKGKKATDLFPNLSGSGILQRFIEVAESGITANFERFYEGSGLRHWFRFTVVKQSNLIVVTAEDISERMEAEAALNKALETADQQRRLYDSVINTTPDLVYVFSLDYIFTYANKALLTMWGKAAEDAIGKGLRDNGYEEWHALMHEREIDEVAATKKPIRGTVSFPHAEFGKRVYDYIFTPIFDENGEVEAIAGTTRDITELKRAEENLQQSENRLMSMIDQTPAPTLVLRGDDLVISQVNKTMLAMIGFGQEVVGTPLLELMPELKDQYIWEQVLKVYREGVNFDQFEVEVSHKRTGELHTYYYNIAYRPLVEDGQITGMIQVAIDVTEQVTSRKKLEESERNFRALVNATSDAVYRMNADWSVMRNLEGRGFLSDTSEPMFNWIDKYIPENDSKRVKAEVAKAVKAKSTFELEHEVFDAEGGIGWTFSRAIPILDENGEISEWFGAASDVTETKKAEIALRESENRYRLLTETLEHQVAERTQELQRSNEDLQQFAHVASHDLKEPVRKIKTFVSRLENHIDDKLDDSASKFIDRIHVATDRMFTMIDGVLAYSTINAGMQQPEAVDLNEVMRNIETDLEVALQKTGGKIQFSNLPTLEGAPVLLYQLFYNLINNSIKFAKADVCPEIAINAEIGENRAKITVSDNGIGFGEAHAQKIFETFTRLHSKDQYEGTGLGLSLCKKIVERHGGTISAHGSSGKGAIFVIELPLVQVENGI
ncbi:PAS domain-containing protein [Flavobacterium sp.]|uniref:PAS domain-containing protein n=1 Tax=Flavobacterium sp. TaxID=239 RepID=UPI0011FD9199|nr:PAS domain-containing protein [Flavobacterium sp.]RZJ71790.1 MAG: PAS domain S-box protein [Flavobacterium sp.]